ncbi:MAG: HAMP domain-containing protein [Deltaproteobacteria bacterium]|nr:HAMP domain-containing protein [Deltaproteobacteria bacterium]
MNKHRFKNAVSFLSAQEIQRRKKEFIIIASIIAIVAISTFIQLKVIRLGTDIPISNAILMFILIDINVMLLILLLFLVFRNLVKLLYDRSRKVMGSKLRTKLAVSFITMTLLPTTILFFLSISLMTTSIKFWFGAGVEKALNNSLSAVESIYDYIDINNRFYLEKISYEVQNKNILKNNKKESLKNYLKDTSKRFNLNGVEIYDKNFKRISFYAKENLYPIGAKDFINKKNSKEIKTVSQKTEKGEIIRIISTIPFGVENDQAKGFAVASTVLSKELSNKINSISKGYKEYRQIKKFKKPIRSAYYITFSTAAFLILFSSLWLGFRLARTISVPIHELAEGLKKVAGGNLDIKVETVADEEIGSLVNSFNKMTKDLKYGRQQLEAATKKLKERNAEIEERRRYMEVVLKNISAGIISINAEGNVATINKSAEKMLNLSAKQIISKNYKKLLKSEHINLVKDIKKKIKTENSYILPIRLTIEGKTKSFMTHITALKDEAKNLIGTVIVFDDLTELEKAERMAAWREVARRIAHEVKNPLTPITLAAQRLQRKYYEKVKEVIFSECTTTIIEHVELIRNLVNEFSEFARFPTANPKPEDVLHIIEDTLIPYKNNHLNIRFTSKAINEIPKINIDKNQIKQALMNLLTNAVASIDKAGEITVFISYDPILKKIKIEMADNGKGILDNEKIRLFEPYFSTKKKGMGLGLAIVNTIISDHNGTIGVYDNIPKGAKFVIELPV